MIEIKVLKVEAETKRISLGMKQLQPNPGCSGRKLPGGLGHRGQDQEHYGLRRIHRHRGGIDGLIHVSDLSWTERIKHLRKICQGRNHSGRGPEIDKETSASPRGQAA